MEYGPSRLTPWYQYSLGVLIYAYREFEQRVGELATAPGAKSEMVQAAFKTFPPGHAFSISELAHLCPTVSRNVLITPPSTPPRPPSCPVSLLHFARRFFYEFVSRKLAQHTGVSILIKESPGAFMEPEAVTKAVETLVRI